MKLLLFDIDGTLLHTNGLSKRILVEALEEILAVRIPIDGYSLSGKTDRRIVAELAAAAGVSPAGVSPQFEAIFRLMGAKWDRYAPEARAQTTLYPAVPELLAALSGRMDLLLGLLTGNAAATAHRKLRAGGLDEALFQVGAFGDEAAERNALPSLAIARAGRLVNRALSGRETVVIGDTPGDIACARAVGATAVAVATGFCPAGELAAHEPDYLLTDLSDVETVLRILLN